MIDFWILLTKLDILKKFLRQFYEGLLDKKVENDTTPLIFVQDTDVGKKTLIGDYFCIGKSSPK